MQQPMNYFFPRRTVLKRNYVIPKDVLTQSKSLDIKKMPPIVKQPSSVDTQTTRFIKFCQLHRHGNCISPPKINQPQTRKPSLVSCRQKILTLIQLRDRAHSLQMESKQFITQQQEVDDSSDGFTDLKNYYNTKYLSRAEHNQYLEKSPKFKIGLHKALSIKPWSESTDD